MSKDKKFFLITFVSYLITVILTFGKLPLTFFQQDEWALFGNLIYWDKANLSWFERLFTFQHFTHVIPFSDLFSYAEFHLFGLNFFPYGIFSIAIHVANAFLVFYLASILSKNKIIAYFSGMLFIISSISHQAITWILTTMGTAGSTFFLLLSLISFVKYSESKEKRFFITSLVFILVSLGFKETSIFVFLFIPLLSYLFYTSKRNVVKISFTMFLLFVGYALFRVLIVFLTPYTPISQTTAIAQPPLQAYLFRSVFIPVRFTVQSIISQDTIIKSASNLMTYSYPQFLEGGSPNPYIVESVASDVIMVGLFSIILFIVGIFFRLLQNKKEARLAKIILISPIFVILSALPLILVPGRAGYDSLIDGRHIYISNIFTSIFIASLGYGIYKLKTSKKVLVFLSLIFLIVIFINISKVRSDINNQVAIASVRKNILVKIQNSYPTLPERVVIFADSDKAYYGLTPGDNILPFQSGFGQTLLIWYSLHGINYPACFFVDQFLYVQVNEGYRECQGRGYGYFRKIDSLQKFVKESRFPVENIIAFTYNSTNNTLTDTSEWVRNSLKK